MSVSEVQSRWHRFSFFFLKLIAVQFDSRSFHVVVCAKTSEFVIESNRFCRETFESFEDLKTMTRPLVPCHRCYVPRKKILINPHGLVEEEWTVRRRLMSTPPTLLLPVQGKPKNLQKTRSVPQRKQTIQTND